MLLVEQHVIKDNDLRFDVIDKASFASKNLYNAANYVVRQSFIFNNKYISYPELYQQLKKSEQFLSLPAKVSQQVLKSLDKAWQSFFAAIKEWKTSPGKFLGRPKLPGYLDKDDGRYLLQYTIQAISKIGLRKGMIVPSKLGIKVETKQDVSKIRQVRVVPKKHFYVVEVIYDKPVMPSESLDYDLVAGIDLGLSNLMAITSNKQGFIPLVVNGRPLKAINQYFNKEKARLQSLLSVGQYTSRRIDRLAEKRNRKVKLYLHTASRMVVDKLQREGIGTLVVGKNVGWKNEISIGRRNNQNFVSIPHAKLIDMITYKCELAGIKVIITEESYTSKTSFLDLETPKKHTEYQGKRVKRGLFRSSSGKKINADVNGSYQIIRKVIPNAFSNGIEDVVVHPVILPMTNTGNVCLHF